MYNFFSDRIKYKAFRKALKQIEAEGFYANLKVDEDTMPVLPDLSKAVASLTQSEESHFEPEQETVNVTELESSLNSQRAIPGADRPKPASPIERVKTEAPTHSSQFYESLFKASPTFLTDDTLEDVEFLDGQPQDFSTKPQLSTTAEVADKVAQSRHRAFASLADRARARRAEQDKQAEETAVIEEIPPIEADIQMPEMEKEPEPEPQPAEVKVEVVADIPEPEPPKTITKTVVITKEIKTVTKPKTKRKTTTTKKKKRKYDADISGGFNY